MGTAREFPYISPSSALPSKASLGDKEVAPTKLLGTTTGGMSPQSTVRRRPAPRPALLSSPLWFSLGILPLLAGCLDSPAATPEVSASLRDGVDAPTWSVGEWFQHEVTLPTYGPTPLQMTTIVVAEEGPYWMLAPNNAEGAKVEAALDLPLLGRIARENLATSLGGSPLSWYEFPLTDDASWTRTIQVRHEGANLSLEVRFTADFSEAIETHQGSVPGFRITAITPDKVTLFEYDYVPALQWFAHFAAYAYTPPGSFGGSESTVLLRAQTRDHGRGWTGTYYVDEAKVVAQSASVVVLFPPPTVDPHPSSAFTVNASAEYVFGLLFAVGVLGAQEVVVRDPAGHQYECQAVLFAEKTCTINAAATAGEWRWATGGVGVVAVGGLVVWEIEETSRVL